MSTLTIDLAKEYKLKIENPDELSKSFFKDVYLKAATQVAEIAKWTGESLSKKDDHSKDFFREEQEYNNIVAFVGERGTGKTSGMITMAQALVKFTKEENQKWLNDADENVCKEIKKFRYESLRIVDPTRFVENENIIEVIIAELFSRFQKKVKDEGFKRDESSKRDVVNAFQKEICFDTFRCV